MGADSLSSIPVMKPWRSFIIIGVLCAYGAGQPLFATEDDSVVFDDKFADNSKNKTGPLDLHWRKVQNIKSIEVLVDKQPGELIPVNYLRVLPEGVFPTFAGIFDTNPGSPTGGGTGLTLGDKEGDRLELLVEFRFMEAETKSTDIRIGLFNNGGTPSIEHSMVPYQNDPGYYVSLPQHGGQASICKDLGKMGSVAGGSDRILLRAAQGTPVPPLKNDWHTMVLTLTRDKQGIMMVAKLDGVACGIGIDSPKPEDKMDPEGLYTVFHEVGFTTGAPNANGLCLRRVLLRGNPKEAVAVETKLSEPAVSQQAAGAAGIARPNWLSMVWVFVGVGVGVGGTLLLTRRRRG